MKKKLLALALSAAAALSGAVSAEQPAAETYREILSSGTYCIEYKQAGYGVKQRLAVQDGNRESWHIIGSGGGLLSAFAKTVVAPGRSSGWTPQYMYLDGNYYFSLGRPKGVFVADEDWVEEKLAETGGGMMPGSGSGVVSDEEEYVRAGLFMLHRELALPEGLIVFAPNDSYNEKAGYQVPAFVESGQTDTKKKIRLGKPFAEDGQVTGKGVLRDYDKYSLTAADPATGMSIEKTFYLYYEAGVLKEIRMTGQTSNMPEPVILGYMQIESITQEIPDDAFVIPAKLARPAGVIADEDEEESRDGTMDDLLGRNKW